MFKAPKNSISLSLKYAYSRMIMTIQEIGIFNCSNGLNELDNAYYGNLCTALTCLDAKAELNLAIENQ